MLGTVPMEEAVSEMQSERMRILKMVEEGKLTPEEAAQLIEAARQHGQGDARGKAGRAAGFLTVRVTESGQPKVNLRVPLSLAKVVLKLLPRQARANLEASGLTVAALGEMIERVANAGPCKLVDIHEGGDGVEIVLE